MRKTVEHATESITEPVIFHFMEELEKGDLKCSLFLSWVFRMIQLGAEDQYQPRY